MPGLARLGRSASLAVSSVVTVVAVASPARATSPRECGADADCAASCQMRVDELRAPAMAPAAFVSAECMDMSYAVEASGCGGHGDPPPPTRGCACNASGGAMFFLSAKADRTDGCLYLARDGSCLFKASDFPGCDLGADAACKTLCDTFHDRRVADAAKSHDASLLGGICGRSGSCRCVLKVGDVCSLDRVTYDCALGARAIVDEAEKDSGAAGASNCAVGGRGRAGSADTLALAALALWLARLRPGRGSRARPRRGGAARGW